MLFRVAKGYSAVLKKEFNHREIPVRCQRILFISLLVILEQNFQKSDTQNAITYTSPEGAHHLIDRYQAAIQTRSFIETVDLRDGFLERGMEAESTTESHKNIEGT